MNGWRTAVIQDRSNISIKNLKLVRNISSMEAVLKGIKKIMPKNGNVSALPLPMNVFRGMEFLLGEAFNMCLFTDDLFLIGEMEPEGIGEMEENSCLTC